MKQYNIPNSLHGAVQQRQGGGGTLCAGESYENAERVAALVSPLPHPSSIEQHGREAPLHNMQHATCNMRLCRQRCELNESCGDGAVGQAAEHPPPHPAFAWRGGKTTVLKYLLPRYRAGSLGRLLVARNPALAASLHMPAPAPAPATAPLFLVRLAGGPALGVVGRRVGEKVPPARFRSVSVGRMRAGVRGQASRAAASFPIAV